jgi:hypothetical protein
VTPFITVCQEIEIQCNMLSQRYKLMYLLTKYRKVTLMLFLHFFHNKYEFLNCVLFYLYHHQLIFFNKYVLSKCYVIHTVLEFGDTQMMKWSMAHGYFSPVGVDLSLSLSLLISLPILMHTQMCTLNNRTNMWIFTFR